MRVSSSSTPRPSRRPTTAPSRRRWPAPAPRSSCSPAASSTAPVPRGRGLPGRGALLPPQRRAAASTRPARRALQGSPSTCPTCCASAARADADVVHYQWLTVPALDAHLLPPAAPAGDDRPLHPAAATRAAARSPRARRVFGAHGRGHRPLRARRRAPARRGRPRPRAGPRHPPRRLRLPHPAAGGEAAAGRAGGRRGPGDPLLRPAAPLQGDRDPARGLPPGRAAPSSGSSATRGWTVEPLRELAARGPRPRPLRHPLRRGRRDPGDLPPRRRRRPSLPRRRALRRPLHRPRLRQADGAQRRRRLPRGRRDRRRPPRRRPATPPRSPPRSRELVGDEAARAELAAAAARAAAGPYSWDEAARRTLDLYRELLAARR